MGDGHRKWTWGMGIGGVSCQEEEQLQGSAWGRGCAAGVPRLGPKPGQPRGVCAWATDELMNPANFRYTLDKPSQV